MTPWDNMVDYERRQLMLTIREIRAGYINAEEIDRLQLFVADALNAKQRAGSAAYWRGEPVHDYRSEP